MNKLHVTLSKLSQSTHSSLSDVSDHANLAEAEFTIGQRTEMRVGCLENRARKLRPQTHRPQTQKTQTLLCLEYSDPRKTQNR